MQSIPPAGWSAHGFFGEKAKTFGNPGGATSGDGYFVPGKGSTGTAWTNRGKPFGHPVFAMASSIGSSGITMAIDTTGQSWLSSDGGHTWAAAGQVFAGFNPGQQAGVLANVSGQHWALTAVQNGVTPDNVFTTANNGTTWSAVASGIGSAGFLAMGSHQVGASGSLLAVANVVPCTPTDYGVSGSGGSLWQRNGVTTIVGGDSQQLIGWDGTQWLVFSSNTAQTVGAVWTAANSGVTWTENDMTNSTSLSCGIFLSGFYYAGDLRSQNLFTGASLAELLTSAPISSNLGASPAIILRAGGGWFVFSTGQQVSGSPDFVTWTPGTLNLTAGEGTVAACYDAIHTSAIAAGSGGSICTVP